MFAAILNYSELSGKLKRTMGVYALAASMFLCAQSVWQKPNYVLSYSEQSGYFDAVRVAIDSIPEDASVGADTFYCAAASKRAELYELDETSYTDEYDYIILDLRTPGGKTKLPSYESSREYAEYYRLNGWIAIYVKN